MEAVNNKIRASQFIEKRRRTRRAGDGCVMTQDQLERLMEKVEQNYDSNLRNEHMGRRITAVEESVKKLCDRMTNAMIATIGLLFVGTGTLIAAIWQIVIYLQNIIEKTMVIT